MSAWLNSPTFLSTTCPSKYSRSPSEKLGDKYSSTGMTAIVVPITAIIAQPTASRLTQGSCPVVSYQEKRRRLENGSFASLPQPYSMGRNRGATRPVLTPFLLKRRDAVTEVVMMIE